jgi:hypothetical protein
MPVSSRCLLLLSLSTAAVQVKCLPCPPSQPSQHVTSWAFYLHTEDAHICWQVLVDGTRVADALWVLVVCLVVHQDAQANHGAQRVHALVSPAAAQVPQQLG